MKATIRKTWILMNSMTFFCPWFVASIGFILCVSACTHTSSVMDESSEGTHLMPASTIHGQPQPELWFKGSLEEAFSQAASSQRLVFLYWGAVWCPPCNELKANVFSQAGFAELMDAFVPVYLDGDTEEAQNWGERLQISGYPTILVLDAERSELIRLSSSMSFTEFSDLIKPLVGQSQTFAKAIQRVESQQASIEDWKLLAYVDWEQLPNATWGLQRRIDLLYQIFQQIPQQWAAERSLVAAQWLSLLTSGKREETIKSKMDRYLEHIPAALDAIFLSHEAIFAARVFINNQAEAISSLLYPKAKGAAYSKFKARWLAAASEIEEDHRVSIDNQLWSVYPELCFFKLENTKSTVSSALQKRVQSAVYLADQKAQDAFSRHAVISGAAYLLRLANDIDGARLILSHEAENTDTPWYYYSSLAALEQEQKNTEGARLWAEKARKSAQGRASKIQWVASDIMLNAKQNAKDRKAYLLLVCKDFYDLATQLNDGFSGRNRRRAESVQEVLEVFRDDLDFKPLFQEYQGRCKQLKGENQKFCLQHFKGLL